MNREDAIHKRGEKDERINREEVLQKRRYHNNSMNFIIYTVSIEVSSGQS